MAFKMTPGIKGNPANNSIMGGGCGGDGQPPCPPRFQAEKNVALVADRSSSSRSKSIKAKKKAAVVAPAPAPAPAPVRLQINLPKGYKFKDELQEKMFYDKFSQALEKGKYKNQEELDKAIISQLVGTRPVGPTDPEGPIIVNPKEPVVVAPIKGGGEFEASPIKSVVKK
jgi:hypothetical protein|tara:strand:+ start:378 stop:887 length:510 start_codon:yes stop_codon:yes gene_type:complete